MPGHEQIPTNSPLQFEALEIEERTTTAHSNEIELDVMQLGQTRDLVQGTPRGLLRDAQGGFIFM